MANLNSLRPSNIVGSGRLRKANPLVPIVKNSVVGTQEHISQDPEGAQGRGNFQAHETRDALLLAHGADLWREEGSGARRLSRELVHARLWDHERTLKRR